MPKPKLKSSLIELAALFVLIHFLSALLYGAAMSPALSIKYGALSLTQMHLLSAAISLLMVFTITLLERKIKKQIIYKVMFLFFVFWLVAFSYALTLPIVKLTLPAESLNQDIEKTKAISK